VLAVRSRPLKSLAVVLCVSLVPLLLAACGGASSAPTTTATTSSLPPIGQPPQPTGPPSRAGLDAVRQAAAHTLTKKLGISVEYKNPTPSVTAPRIGASGWFNLSRATGVEDVHDPTGEETIVFLPQRVFVLPAKSEVVGLPHGKTWVRADFNEHLPGRSAGALSEFLLRLKARDIGFLLSQLAWGAKTAAPLGHRGIAGKPATGYLVHVDLDRAAAAAAGPSAKGFVRLAALAKHAHGGGHASDQTIWVWLDGSNRVVALRASTPGSGIGTTLMNVTSFGRLAVTPTTPPADAVVDVATLTPAGDNDGD
jgi:hypothetical protein